MNRPHDELTLARACAPLFAQFAGRGSRAKSRSHPTPRELSIDVLFVSVTPANMEFRSLPDVEKGVLTLQLFVVVALKQAFFSTVLSQLLDERCIETVEVQY
eukprot:31035-Pelagococcus_subviridis.AAC.1